MPPTRRPRLPGLLVAAGLAAAAAAQVGSQAPARAASSGLAIGVPTFVDPIRSADEPDIVVDKAGNALISGPGGSSAQTSFFFRTRNGGLTFPGLGPANAHWVCSQTGGGDSLGAVDRSSGAIYVTDQESLANLATGRIDPNGALTSSCTTAPPLTADRPFDAVLPAGSAAPQSQAAAGKPIVYQTWQCNGCGARSSDVTQDSNTAHGGVALAWTTDGVAFHPAEPGTVPGNNPFTATASEGRITPYVFHGTAVVDPVNGNLYVGLNCATSCFGGKRASNGMVEVAVAKPPATVDPANPGGFASISPRVVATKYADGSVFPSTETLFPVVQMDSARNLYVMWSAGDGTTDPTVAPDSHDFHIYYAYSLCSPTDNCEHTVWSSPIQVDTGDPVNDATSTFGWMAAGDPGKLGFIYLGTAAREHPSNINAKKTWHPFISVTTTGLSASPAFEQSQVGIGPTHIGDICLHGTTCLAPGNPATGGNAGDPPGNRNLADFISADIGSDGALQVTYANDANQISTSPTTIVRGLPLTMYARQIGGPRLVGTGDVSDTRFSTTPTTGGVTSGAGDAFYDSGSTQVSSSGAAISAAPAQLDLTGSRIEWDGTNLIVHVSAANLSRLASPDSAHSHVWWLTTWEQGGKLHFAKAESDAGAAPTFSAGVPASYDRPGLGGTTVPTLGDYRGGTAVTGTVSGNQISITVPASVVGSPKTGDVLESVTAFTVLDNGNPPIVAPVSQTNNIPPVVDATPAYDALLATGPPTQAPEAPSVVALALIGGGIALAAAAVRRRRSAASA